MATLQPMTLKDYRGYEGAGPRARGAFGASVNVPSVRLAYAWPPHNAVSRQLRGVQAMAADVIVSDDGASVLLYTADPDVLPDGLALYQAGHPYGRQATETTLSAMLARGPLDVALLVRCGWKVA